MAANGTWRIEVMPHGGYAVEEVARRGRDLYEREIREKVEDEHTGKFLVVDVDSGEYEIAEEDIVAFDRALANNPDAVLYGIRIGESAAYRLGRSCRVVGLARWR